HFYFGFGFSLLSQVIDTSRRSPAYSLDMGIISTTFFENHYVNRVDIGASVVGAFSTGLPSWTYDSTVGTSKEQSMERQIYVGGTISMFDYSTQIKTGLYSQGIALRDGMFGLNYSLADGLALRLSTTYDFYQGQEFVYNFGTGLLLRRVAGLGNNIYDMSVDYTYTMYPSPRTDDPSHSIGLSFLGQSTDERPVVLLPSRSYKTLDSTADFNGTSDRNALVFIYNGESLVGQVRANNNGKWVVDQLPLDVGYNSITFRSKSLSKDLSRSSDPIVIHFDKTPPKIETNLNIIGNRVEIRLNSNEPLKDTVLVSGNQKIGFRKLSDRQYSLVVDLPANLRNASPLPDQMLTYGIVAQDEIGNVAPTESIAFFVEPLFPSDQTVVYNDAITVLGYASKYVEQISINGNVIETDKNDAFSTSVELNYGKQVLLVNVKTKNGRELQYYARLLCIKRFPDIPKFAKYRRDIEFLATMGYVDGKSDGLFHPDEEMTRRDVTLAIAKARNIEAKEIQFDPFLDVKKSDPDAGVISAAVDAGITFAYADGTFRPNEKVSVADAFKMLNNAGVIDSEEVVVSKAPIKRFEFALFFKQVRRYDQRVNYLLDWDQGYNLPN
ncbi:MAG: S-layer homology domain-containing protein, partial [Candidatus Margulisiibacteriota bacterium]